jgi:hypothetical protein
LLLQPESESNGKSAVNFSIPFYFPTCKNKIKLKGQPKDVSKSEVLRSFLHHNVMWSWETIRRYPGPHFTRPATLCTALHIVFISLHMTDIYGKSHDSWADQNLVWICELVVSCIYWNWLNIFILCERFIRWKYTVWKLTH